MLSQFLRAASFKPGAALTFVGVAEASTGTNTNSLTVSYPAGVQTGDLAFMCITVPVFSGDVAYTSTGWTSLNVRSEGNVSSQLLYRVVDTTGSQSFTRTGTAPTRTGYLLAVFRNANYSSFSFAVGNDNANPPVLSGTYNAVVAFGNVAVADSTIAPPSGYTTLGEISGGGISTCGGYLISQVTNPNPGQFAVAQVDYIAYTIGLT